MRLFGLCSIALCAACGGEPAIRLVIDHLNASAPQRVSVEIVASDEAPPRWRVCEPVFGALDTSAGWPLTVVIERGPEFDAMLAFRVLGCWSSSTTAVIGSSTWPREGARDIAVDLVHCEEGRCLDEHPAGGANADCACVDENIPPIFDDSSYWVEGVSCAFE